LNFLEESPTLEEILSSWNLTAKDLSLLNIYKNLDVVPFFNQTSIKMSRFSFGGSHEDDVAKKFQV